MSSAYQPSPADKFTFGLWTVGNIGRDPFGEPVRGPSRRSRSVHLLAEVGAYGVNFHDNDLIPIDATPAERDQIVRDFKQALADTAWSCRWRPPTCSATRLQGRRVHLQRRPRCAPTRCRRRCAPSTWASSSARRSTSSGAGAKASRPTPPRTRSRRLKRYREAMNFLCEYVARTEVRPASSRSKPSPTSRAATSTCRPRARCSASSRRSITRRWSASTPRWRTSTWRGSTSCTRSRRRWDAGKLFHIDLNDQAFGRYDQDFRFGSRNLKAAFFLVKFLEDVGYAGSRHFDAHAYRTEDYEGVKDFARGCMRTYLILKEKARRFNADREIQAVLAQVSVDDGSLAQYQGAYSRSAAEALKGETFDRVALGNRAAL